MDGDDRVWKVVVVSYTLRKEFEVLDTDGSGEISLKALKQVLLKKGGSGSLGALKEDEVEDIFNAMRVDKTETRIHWHEFIAAGLSQCQVDDRNMRLAFDRLDSHHEGVRIALSPSLWGFCFGLSLPSSLPSS